MKRLSTFAVALALLTTAVQAASPDLGFVKISGGTRRLYELRVAGEDGTGATTLYSTRDIGQMMIRMGPRADHTIIVIQGGRFSLLRYTVTFSGPQMLSIEPLLTIYSGSGAASVDFSPNGKDVAYAAGGGTTINIFNLDTRTSRVIAHLPSYSRGLSFNHDGSQVYYFENVSNTDAVLKKVAVAGGGDPILVGIEGDYDGVRVGRTVDSILTSRKNVRYDALTYFAPGSTSPSVIATGSIPSFRCDDAMIIYQKVNSDNSVSLLRRDMLSGAPYTFSTSGYYYPDYISTCV